MLEAVVPVAARDRDRFEILHASLRRFFPDLARCWIVTPARECALFRGYEDDRYRVVAETSVIPELRPYYVLCRLRGRKPYGWMLQQLIKFAIVDRVQAPFYLTLDADVICARPVRDADLIKNGRAVSHRHRHDVHAQWYECAERVLGMRRSGWTHGVTPALFSTDAMHQLHRHLARRARVGGWRASLLRNLNWTEVSLYHTFLEASGLYDRYHVDVPSGYLYDGVWEKNQFEQWQPRRTAAFFAVVQSHLGIGPEVVWRKLFPNEPFPHRREEPEPAPLPQGRVAR